MGYLWLISDRMLLTEALKLAICVAKKAINDLKLPGTALKKVTYAP
jgi:hypothetical protein